MNLNSQEVENLISLLRKQILFQTATRVWNGVEIDRVNLAIMWQPYCQIMELINKAGGFVPPKEVRTELLKIHAEKARQVGDGTYDLKEWSSGELVMAIDEAKGVRELEKFAAACEAELKVRGELNG